MVVHLYGQVAQMNKIIALSKSINLKVIEDCAQSHGALLEEKMTRGWVMWMFFFYPSKNLGGFGEGGAVVTDNEELANEVRILRNYGSEKKILQ